MISQAFASAAEAAPKAPGMMDMLLPLGLMFLVFYFLLIRPNQKKMKLREDFLSKLSKGDSVITTGGVLGRVIGLTDLYVTLDLGDNVKIKVLRSHIGSSAKDLEKEHKEKTNK